MHTPYYGDPSNMGTTCGDQGFCTDGGYGPLTTAQAQNGSKVRLVSVYGIAWFQLLRGFECIFGDTIQMFRSQVSVVKQVPLYSLLNCNLSLDNVNRDAAMEVSEPDELLNPSSDHSRELLHTRCIVNQLDKEVRRDYASFAKDLQALLERKGVHVDDAIHSFAYYLDESDLTSDMREASNIGAFLLALKRTQSWYNFDTTAHLAEDLGEDEGKKLVESYEAKLKVHLKRRRKAFKTQTRQFVVKVDEKREHFTKEKIVEFRNTVAKLMKIKHKDLTLKSTKDGCVELTYLFHFVLAPKIRSAIGECINELKKLRIISVSIDG